MQQQLKSVGIELVPNFGPNTLVFGQVLPSGDWDLFMFTFSSSPASQTNSFGIYGCGGGQNYMNWCNQGVRSWPGRLDHARPGEAAR